jgi:outer membrane protein TolC
MVKIVIKIIAFFSLIFLNTAVFTQIGSSIKLEDCYQWALERHPLQSKPALLDQQTQLKLEQIDLERLPQLRLNAQTSYQSETVQFPLEIPGAEIPELPLFRAQASVDGSYLLYDGGLQEARKSMEQSALNTALQSVIVEQYPLHSQVNQAYFGILLAQAQVRVLEQSGANIDSRIAALEVAKEDGVALQVDIDQLKVRQLEIQQQIQQLEGRAREAIQSLATLTGQSFGEEVSLEVPEQSGFQFDQVVQRPELELFQLQKLQILSRESLIEASRKPKVNLFLQAGLGYPHPLNFFDDSLNPFAIGGIGFSWAITDWKKSSVDRQLLSVQTQLVDNQEAVFLDQIEKMKSPYQERLRTLENLAEQGQQIVALQKGILETFSTQLDLGVRTSTDYIEQLNKTTQAELNLKLYQLQMEQLKVEYRALLGL